jgi:hypothetical protein
MRDTYLRAIQTLHWGVGTSLLERFYPVAPDLKAPCTAADCHHCRRSTRPCFNPDFRLQRRGVGRRFDRLAWPNLAPEEVIAVDDGAIDGTLAGEAAI